MNQAVVTPSTNQTAGQTICLIEDDPDILRLIERELTSRQYRVQSASRGAHGLQMARTHGVDLVVLDLLLPDMSGLEICRTLRQGEATRGLPILILTALAAEADRVRGLDLGADDYLSKPFSLRELVTRIRALLRRSAMGSRPHTAVVGDLSIDRTRHEVVVRGRTVAVTPTEFSILEFLARHHGQVFTREQLLTHLWGEDCFILDHNLDVHMFALRRKIEEDPKRPKLLLTLRGVGFKLNDSAA